MPTVDFVVIGGGCSGTYIAWRLAETYPKNSIQLYEASGRIGGRLLTVEVPGTEALTGKSVRVELGGMRFLEGQLLIRHLIAQLGLNSRDFEYPISHYHLRGKHYYASDSKGAPYLLKEAERGKGPAELVKHAIITALKAIDPIASDTSSVREKLDIHNTGNLNYANLKPFEWEMLKRFATINETPLWRLGFWNLLFRFLSSEAYFLAHDGLGYHSILTNWNAAEAIPWFLRDFDCSYKTVEEGMESIPSRIGEKLEGTRPNSVVLEHTATIIKRLENKCFRIAFATRKGPQEVDAINLILAMPKNALEHIQFVGFPEESLRQFREDLSSVSSHALLKLILGYESPWWRNNAATRLEHTRAVTDLPIRQIYYFDSESRLAKAASRSDSSVGILMASYSDAHYVDFWQPLIRKPNQNDVHYKGGSRNPEEERSLKAFGAMKRLVDKAQRQVRELHPEVDPPDPYVGLVMDWSRPPYLGGWHTWQASVRAWKVIDRMKNPFSNLHVCGEAYSAEQGWVEGALRSAELVLNSMGVPPPDWVPHDAYVEQQFSGYLEYIGAAAVESP
jgi:lysine 2-monooxygenase